MERAIRVFVHSNFDDGDQNAQLFAYDQVLTCAGYKLPLLEEVKTRNTDNEAVIQRIQFDLKQATKRRKVIKADIERATKCKSVRSPNGVYKYFDLETGRTVDPSEYKLRYLSHILKPKVTSPSFGDTIPTRDAEMFPINDTDGPVCLRV